MTFPEKQEPQGSQKAPIAEAMTGRFGHRIEPGDPVITFTQAGRATRVEAGTYLGTMTAVGRWNTWTYFIVERQDGKRTKLTYNGIVPRSISIDELIGSTI